MILCGDFNMDQMPQENVNAFQRLLQEFNLHQRVTYSTHIHGGILPGKDRHSSADANAIQ